MNVWRHKLLACLLRDETGASAVEYAVMLALILMVAFVAIQALGGSVNNAFQLFVDTFRSARS